MKTLAGFVLALLSGLALADAATDVSVSKIFARPALRQQANSAIFMQLDNRGGDASLVSAVSDAARVVELHTHTNDNGVMRMRKIDRIDLPAGERVMLKPGGLHIMLIGLTRDLVMNDTVEVTLRFSDGSETIETAPIQRVMREHGSHGQMKKMEH